ncbi:MAG: class I SAM-dependent methyltransferase [Desulfurococcales archaeon]|nr:class I SAM-dependent methyltransferase [Desulfurococcales archaeon]
MERDDIKFDPSGIDAELRWIALTLGGGIGVPFVPTRDDVLDLIFKALDLREGDVFYDLGCGNGKVVVEAARRYPIKRGVCVEARRDLAEEARKRAREAGVSDRVIIVNDDMFKVDISDATAVYMYLLTSVNEMLKPKLAKELRRGTRIATLDFQIPGWKPVKVLGDKAGWQRTIYLYIIGVSDTGGEE